MLRAHANLEISPSTVHVDLEALALAIQTILFIISYSLLCFSHMKEDRILGHLAVWEFFK